MEKQKHYKYPLWLELIIRGHSGIMIAMMIIVVIFFIITVDHFRAFTGMLAIVIPVFLAALIALFFLVLSNLLTWPQIEVENGKFRLIGLFSKSQWIEIDEILSLDFRLLLRDPSGYFEPIMVDQLGIFKRTLIVECDKLPWICRFSRLIVGKKNPVFLIGERIQEFEELRGVLASRQD